jgi:hypothetical protein
MLAPADGARHDIVHQSHCCAACWCFWQVAGDPLLPRLVVLFTDVLLSMCAITRVDLLPMHSLTVHGVVQIWWRPLLSGLMKQPCCFGLNLASRVWLHWVSVIYSCRVRRPSCNLM